MARIPRTLLTLLALAAAASAGGQALDPSLLNHPGWRSLGPSNTGGRVDDFAVARVPGAPDAIYVATASGGVFKSTNQGTSWTPIFDHANAMMSIGAVAVAPSNPNIVWVGTGEANNRQSSSWGDGVYRSLDGGRTWSHRGLADTKHIGRIVIHPTNPDIVYVAALGHLWGRNAERGVFRTSDGGRSWAKVLAVDDDTGAADIVMDPKDPDTLFAAMYQRRRKAWGFDGGGSGSGIYRTLDGGATWAKLEHGLPAGDKGRIGLALFARDARIVYATVEAKGAGNGVYRSVDRGDTWEQLTTLNPRPMYYSQIRIDPRDRDRVYLLGSNRGFYVSDDGGRNFRDVFSTVHSEDHALWVDPDDSNHLLVGGDGGVSISWDRGATWMFRDNLPIGQFYEISADLQDPYVVCGGLQDNGMWCTPSATRNTNGLSNADAYNIGGGDGFYARIDVSDPRTVYIDSQEGRSSRVDLRTMERQVIAPVPSSRPANGERERWSWDTPVLVSSFDPSVVYTGSNALFRSADRGLTWKAISPDLTAHIDRETLEMMGGPVPQDALSRHDGQASYGTITALAESPLDARVLYVGSDDGLLHVTRDGGASWTDLTASIPHLPPHTYVSSVLASRHAAGRVYATFDGHYDDDYGAYLFVSQDYGGTWRSIAGGLPTSVHRIREHPRNPNLLFAGTERGLDVSIDGGATWTPLGGGLPPVPVDDLLIHPRDNDLVVGTHGRGIWILDDIGAIESLTSDVLQRQATLLPSRPGRLLSMHTPQAWFGAGQFFAPNPPFGAAITYYLKQDATRQVEIAVQAPDGSVVRTLEGTGNRGLNRVVWDLRIAPPLGDESTGPAPEGGPAGAPRGPLVLPGAYRVTIRGAGPELRGTVVVEGDPRVTFSGVDRQARQTALLNLYELQSTVGKGREAVRRESSALELVRKSVADRGAVAPLADRASAIDRQLARALGTTAALSRAIEGYSGRPTADQQRQIDWAFDDVTKAITDLDRLLQDDIPALFSDLTRQHLWPPRVDPIPPPTRRP